ncbi:hypothetical protein J3Q64DRAFT_1475153 [Phycomyces blakesleeanus]|uniref:Galactose oxidase n=1 Tax=Phycomyces blakesleeanus TaxID=4837 RepID=A0ABR3B0J7_PHYBL
MDIFLRTRYPDRKHALFDRPKKQRSIDIQNSNCPVLHFPVVVPDFDGESINAFGTGSYTNTEYISNMIVCQYNTKTSNWKQISIPNAPLGRRNYGYEYIRSNGQTLFWGGDSDPITGLNETANYIWHKEVSMTSRLSAWVNPNLPYTGLGRTNATLTQFLDTNSRIAIIGGAVIDDESKVDSVTNFPMANMSDIILYDARTQNWDTAVATGQVPVGRKHHTATLLPDGNRILLYGGELFNDSGYFVLNDVAILDTTTWIWSIPNCTGTGLTRSNHTSIVIGNQLWVIAGSNGPTKAVDIQILDLDTYTWTFDAKGNRSKFSSIEKRRNVLSKTTRLYLTTITTIPTITSQKTSSKIMHSCRHPVQWTTRQICSLTMQLIQVCTTYQPPTEDHQRWNRSTHDSPRGSIPNIHMYSVQGKPQKPNLVEGHEEGGPSSNESTNTLQRIP